MWLVAPATARASPKSATLTRPSSESSTFSGFTSRWTMPGLVRGAERGEHRLEHLERLPRAQAAARRGAGRAGCGRGRCSIARNTWPVVGALVVDGDHVGVRQPGRGLRLADEPGDELLVLGQRRVHHLEGDRAVEPGVVGLVDGGHAAARQARTRRGSARRARCPTRGSLTVVSTAASLRVARPWPGPDARYADAQLNRALRDITLAHVPLACRGTSRSLRTRARGPGSSPPPPAARCGRVG